MRKPFLRIRRYRKVEGQVVVEMLLILPVFLLMIFLIMEIGHIAFQTIVVNHAAYEVARIGAQLAGAIDPDDAPDFRASRARGRASKALNQMLRKAKIKRFRKITTFTDPQTDLVNYDLEVEVEDNVELIFPGARYVFSTPRGTCCRKIRAKVRMPVENPVRFTLR